MLSKQLKVFFKKKEVQRKMLSQELKEMEKLNQEVQEDNLRNIIFNCASTRNDRYSLLY